MPIIMDLLNTLGVSAHISSKWTSTLISTRPLTLLAITSALLASYPILKLFYALFLSHTIYTHFHPLRRLPRIKERPSLLLGANQVILDSPPGQAERRWLDTHDTTVIVYPGFLGTHSVYVADPTAIHHLFGPGHGAYEKSEIRQRILRVLLGQGLVTATSKQAVKQRRIIVPALQTRNLERLAPVFQDACEGMVGVVKENLLAAQNQKEAEGTGRKPMITGGNQHEDKGDKGEMTVLDLGDVLWACSLDIIGKAGFGYDFHAVQSARRRVSTTGTTDTINTGHTNSNSNSNSVLDEKNLSTYTANNATNTTTVIPPQNRLARAFDDAMEATLKPSTFDRLVTLVAAVLFPVFTMLPITKANRECVKARKLMDHVAGGILDQRLDAVEEAGLKEKADFEGDQKDLLGVLVRANRATDLKPDQRLTRPELLGQLTTFLVAGHETTAAAAAWLLYYLSLYPDIQARVYEEVKELDRKVASEGEGREGGRPTWREMAELPLLRACFFEASRLQPSLPVTHRDAVEDDVIPLSRPLRASDNGEPIESMFVPKGTVLTIGIAAINRSTDIWGADANEFKPDRWFDLEADKHAPPLKTWSFMMGPRTCPGWRYAQVQVMCIISSMLREFELHYAGLELQAQMAKIIAGRPIVKDQADVGSQLPIGLTFRNKDKSG
ncbi:hypothetical protein FFLO_03978 [Filobasidium floriforme]|uniref:Cytochrome P450 n=1 Tax=Filobasidium floriforme TaxID=5210 RepID=A0A8K0JK43_9TREE|nr:hypothetical protein FFLO_03978 [Filobasidium floriforme]